MPVVYGYRFSTYSMTEFSFGRLDAADLGSMLCSLLQYKDAHNVNDHQTPVVSPNALYLQHSSSSEGL